MNTQVITCSEFVDLLHPYLDGELTIQKTQEFDDHMVNCPKCKALFDEMATILGYCHTLDEGLEIPESYKQGWRNAIRQEAATASIPPIALKKRNHWMRPLTAIAAAFVVLVGSTFYLNSQGLMPGKDKSGNNWAMTQSENENEAYRQKLYGSSNTIIAKNPGYDTARGSVEEFIADDYQMMDGDTSLMAGEISNGTPISESVRSTITDTNTKLQMMRRTATLNLLSVTFDDVKTTIEEQITTHGAYIQQTTLSGQQLTSPTQTIGRNLNLTIRVPSVKLDDFISGIAGVAEVTFREVRAEDLSKNYTETQLQIEMLKTAHAKIEQLIDRAESLTDVSTMMQEALQIQYQIESLSGALRTWDDEISMSTVYVNLTEVQNVDKAISEKLTLYQRIKLGFDYSMESLGEFLSDMAVTIAMFVPQLILFLPVLLLLLLLIRRARKNHKSKNKK